MTCLQLYLLFVKISFFTFGGGYAMVPLFQDELVTKGHFLNGDAFANLIAMAQVTPGPIGLNAATYIGYEQLGVLGALAGNLGLMTPAFIVTLLAAVFLQKSKNSLLMKNIMQGIRPAVLGLIASAVIFFANTSVFSAPINNLWTSGAKFGLSWQGTFIFIAAILLEKLLKLNMVYVLLISAVMGYVLFLF